MESTLNVPIILASTSPRRIDLMKQVGLDIIVRAPGTVEKRNPRELPPKMVARLALEKAEAVVTEALWEFGGALIIAADTIVVAPNGKSILGKPRDSKDAIKMLSTLQGKTHAVLTGYCILQVGREMETKKVVRVVTSKVTMRKLSKIEINRYVASEEPMDKAGSYAAQGIGMALIDRISGSYSNVVGLPLCQLLQDLESSMQIELLSWRNTSRTDRSPQ